VINSLREPREVPPFCAAADLIPIKAPTAQIWALCDPQGEADHRSST
jgi:hypothetical protein